ncbi:hypothetical protein QAD02_020558 [Eretmocerus hayati]|uniref:Uncharacterized protein n=1 Tax=Eretmocerus hayati TaxID=131215 RepID=A0ACC2PSJ8_9HYME|nr:hypothetical protein QAD02_020558 [Eretmocerus hayati]
MGEDMYEATDEDMDDDMDEDTDEDMDDVMDEDTDEDMDDDTGDEYSDDGELNDEEPVFEEPRINRGLGVLMKIHNAYTQLLGHGDHLRRVSGTMSFAIDKSRNGLGFDQSQEEFENYSATPPDQRNERRVEELRINCKTMEKIYTAAYNEYNELLSRGMRPYYDPLPLPDHRFQKKCRFTKKLSRKLMYELRGRIPQTPRSTVHLDLKVLIGMGLFASGSYQDDIADNKHHQVSKASVSRYFHELVSAMSMMTTEFIKFPSTKEERLHTSEQFSINLQVADANGVVRSVRAGPGTNHDQFMYNHSELRIVMDHQYRPANTDSGYATTSTILTPVEHADPNTPEGRYTRDHRIIRSKIERIIGDVGNSFRVIRRERLMRYDPDTVVDVKKASVVFHNYRLLDG